MIEALQTYLERIAPMPAAEVELLKSTLRPRQLKKGEFMIRAGEISRHAAFVVRGFLRAYVIDEKGKEHIVQFAPENWWISESPGISTDQRAPYFIDALEDTDALMIDLAGHKTLMAGSPVYAASFGEGTQRKVAAKDKRIVQSLSADAEERYRDFMETYPSIVQRVPQHMLASYLGVTPETLSRIRKKATQKK